MKIVLNKCYGGFGLSHAAMMKIFELKGITVFPYVCKINYDSDGETIYTYSRMKGDFEPIGLMEHVSYFQIDPEVDSYTVTSEQYYSSDDKYDEKDLDYSYDDKKRTEPELVKAVETLGALASGKYSNLKVVEIPDNFEYRIDDYDGIEKVYFGLQMGSA
ncbi:hypothetical protein [Enterococcus pallens]|uniref:Uncharacterized protein n=1 Tax=Enterococcus pallens ATCC BAA-351 TaxID=1158607 RepID=R2SU81_9ENTE|nr:hypothetical protein [Enterococcus pallens]EOH94807.1 hypothetical protein UAU_01729 [Enterococcus pallens ATCC BAA-351]EOH96361.1 hypothetical protein UAU_01011 [Enterococcus pallens ATCC BAA-351]EOU14426.1 hypothetical protein I588_04783 [Enterococcus pallens ATCC BAA-351]EOU14874.1 hypothetical protein I588_04524 [Enterococcus pallens ATCC BAA-351]OJG68166.1 hypothetical protein RV10_GL001176 [Enterococcus pallens]